MNYVFFDVECANCIEGKGKICSFGFVKTDENFNVLQKKDILIDPNAPFLLGNAKKGMGIKLAYPLFKFRRAFTFPHYYAEIKKILEDQNNMCFGFAVSQDVGYLLYSCQRYQLVPFSFAFFDIQKLEMLLYHHKNASGLDHLVEYYNVQSYTYHRSDDDALMSMEVFREMLKKEQLPVNYVLTKYSDCLSNTDLFIEHFKAREKEKEHRKIVQKKIEEFFIRNSEANLENYDKFFWKKKFFISRKVLSDSIDDLLLYKDQFYKKGGSLIKNPYDANIIVVLQKKDMDCMKLDKEKLKNVKILSYNSFIQKLQNK